MRKPSIAVIDIVVMQNISWNRGSHWKSSPSEAYYVFLNGISCLIYGACYGYRWSCFIIIWDSSTMWYPWLSVSDSPCLRHTSMDSTWIYAMDFIDLNLLYVTFSAHQLLSDDTYSSYLNQNAETTYPKVCEMSQRRVSQYHCALYYILYNF